MEERRRAESRGSRLLELLFPDPPRSLPASRGIRIAFRTAHIASFGVVLGGHFFDIEPARLLWPLYATVATGAGLIAVELHKSCRWAYQGMGVMTLLKCALLLVIPWAWSWRVPILLVVVVLGSVGSHMPSRFRYYSFIHRRPLE